MRKSCRKFLIIMLVMSMFCSCQDNNTDSDTDKTNTSDIAELYDEPELISSEMYGEHIILRSNKCDLEYAASTELELTVSVPEDQNVDNIQIISEDLDDNELYVSDWQLTENTRTIGTITYNDYVSSVMINDAGDDDTSFSKKLSVKVNGTESNDIILYRDIDLPEEAVVRACDVLDDLCEYTDPLFEKIDKNATLEERIEQSSEILDKVEEKLRSDSNIAYAERSGSMVNFRTVDGFSSFFGVEFPELGLAGSSTNVPVMRQNVDDLSEYLHRDYNMNITMIDPDVKVILPLKNNAVYTDRQGDNAIECGRKLANYLGGTYSENADEVCLDLENLRGLQDYGTVIFASHGNSHERGDGTKVISWTIYASYDMKQTQNALNSAMSAFQDFETINEPDDHCARIKFLADENSNRYAFGMLVGYEEKDFKRKWVVNAYSDAVMQVLSDADFPNTIFYSGSCYGFADKKFNQFLIDHGASCVIGYESQELIFNEEVFCDHLFSHLIEEKKDKSTGLKSTRSIYDVWNDYKHSDVFNDDMYFLGSVYAKIKNRDRISRYTSLHGEYDFRYYAEGNLSGCIKTPDGKAIPNAKVAAYRYDNNAGHEILRSAEVTADKKGKYVFNNLRWGTYLIEAYTSDNKSVKTVSFVDTEKKNFDIIIDNAQKSIAELSQEEIVKAVNSYLSSERKWDKFIASKSDLWLADGNYYQLTLRWQGGNEANVLTQYKCYIKISNGDTEIYFETSDKELESKFNIWDYVK